MCIMPCGHVPNAQSQEIAIHITTVELAQARPYYQLTCTCRLSWYIVVVKFHPFHQPFRVRFYCSQFFLLTRVREREEEKEGGREDDRRKEGGREGGRKGGKEDIERDQQAMG